MTVGIIMLAVALSLGGRDMTPAECVNTTIGTKYNGFKSGYLSLIHI